MRVQHFWMEFLLLQDFKARYSQDIKVNFMMVLKIDDLQIVPHGMTQDSITVDNSRYADKPPLPLF